MGSKVRVKKRKAPRSTRTTRLRDWKPDFLEHLRRDPNVSAACKSAGVARRTVYDARDNDPNFAQAWDEADEAALDLIEAAGFEMAIAKTSESPSLIKFFLQTRRPHKFPNVSKLEVAGVNGKPIPVAMTEMTEQEAADYYHGLVRE